MSYAEYLLNAKSKKISDHFTLYDVCHSDTALKNKIDNTPTPQIIINSTLLANRCLETIRNHFNKPLIVNCIFRCQILNTKVGGATNSQHRFGQACDFTVSGADLKIVFAWCKANLNYDQLIYETTTKIDPVTKKVIYTRWIHISYSNIRNRKEALTSLNGFYTKA